MIVKNFTLHAVVSVLWAILLFSQTKLVFSSEYYMSTQEIDQTTSKECSACHFAYSPKMLPARSWGLIMKNLDNHFGEDASLPEKTVRHIEGFLRENSADSGFRNTRFMRGIAPGETPIRITETPYWQREHRKLRRKRYSEEPIPHSSCQRCHQDAHRGGYDD